MARIIEAIPSPQPASLKYQMMTCVMCYGGLRPSEVVMLRAKALELPEAGWGRISVTEADVGVVGKDEPGEPKTGPRSIPIPPSLVARLRTWIDEHHFSGDDLIFRTAKGTRPTASNWARALQRATRAAGCSSLRVYDCRHFAATSWLDAGVPLGEVAKRMGHSVQTLVNTYVGAMSGDEAIANQRIEAGMAGPDSAGANNGPGLGSDLPARGFDSVGPQVCLDVTLGHDDESPCPAKGDPALLH
ncbi:MAG: tyrosine-type recombinase/integrase [Acidimicrobiales bacterium]